MTRREWIEIMGNRPVTSVWGIGERTASRLADAGIRTVVELARADPDDLARRFGPRIGPSLKVLGLGGDDAPVVDEPYVAEVAQPGGDVRARSHQSGCDRRTGRPVGGRGH